MNRGAETNASIIIKRKNQVLDRQGYRTLFVRVLGLVLAGWFLLSKVFFITQVSGNDMFPAMKDGDLVIAFRLQQAYVKNDVVVYQINGKTHIGRVIAKETDYVQLDDSGSLLVNGTDQSGEILYPTYAKDGITYPYAVLEGQVFVLGDYRTQAKDSRDFGAISLKNVQGKVITILRRRGL